MGLENDNLSQLSASGDRFNIASGRPSCCLQQMLSALDYLACKGIVHRDVKPENILCSRQGLDYHFRLTDFGVGKLAKHARSYQGSDWYVAPEILKLWNYFKPNDMADEPQSPKVDVWSLFVTIAYARDVCNYRTRRLNTSDDFLDAAREACTESWMSKYSDMAIEDPIRRASASDILQQSFQGVGITERNDDIKMSEDNDYLFLDPQLAEPLAVARSPIPPRRSMRVQPAYKKCKPTWPPHMLDRLNAVANEL